IAADKVVPPFLLALFWRYQTVRLMPNFSHGWVADREFGLRAHSQRTTLGFLGHTVAAQFLPGAFFDVDAADSSEAQSLPLVISDAQEAGQIVSREVLARDRRFLGNCRRFGLGDLAAHPLGRLHHRPNLILGFAVVPGPSDQPSVEVLSLRRVHMARVQNDFSAAFGTEVKIAVAPPAARAYTHNMFLQNCPAHSCGRAFFCN